MKKKVTVIGAGNVGATSAMRLAEKELADVVGVNSWQVRKDFSYFGAFGKPGSGYDIENLKKQILKILKLNLIIYRSGWLMKPSITLISTIGLKLSRSADSLWPITADLPPEFCFCSSPHNCFRPFLL